MTEDRRQPLGGVSKEEFVKSGGNGLTYELISGMKSDLCHEIKLIKDDTTAIKAQCSCRVVECKNEFDGRYIKRVHPKIPMSLYEFIAYLLIVGALFGLGYKITKLPLPIF